MCECCGSNERKTKEGETETVAKKNSNRPATINHIQLAESLSEAFRGTVGNRNSLMLFRHLLQLLAKGKPVSPEEIAIAIGRSSEEVVTILRKMSSAEFDDKGNLIGMGLTLNPTSYRFVVEGRTLFTWCALDTLMFPAILGKRAKIESTCPTTGTSVRVQVGPNEVERVEPSDAVVSLIIPENAEDIRDAFCDYVHFFSSSESAREWLIKHPRAFVLSVADAQKVGHILVKNLFGENLGVKAC